MKQKVIKFISCAFIILTLIVVLSCRDIFHSKEDIDYLNLVINKEYNNSVEKGDRNYYKFHAEKGVMYYISWDVSDHYSHLDIAVATFWYDSGGTITGERKDYYTGDSGPSFIASRSGDVVIRITCGKREGESHSYSDVADYKFMVSTQKNNYAGK